MIWEPCLDDICCPPFTRGGGMTVPELLPVKIWSEDKSKGNLVCYSMVVLSYQQSA